MCIRDRRAGAPRDRPGGGHAVLCRGGRDRHRADPAGRQPDADRAAGGLTRSLSPAARPEPACRLERIGRARTGACRPRSRSPRTTPGSNVLLVLVPLMPTLPLAAAVLL